jgi:hypothetical protein
MVLTEEEKKEYLINYKPQPKWHSEFAQFFVVVFATWFFFSVLCSLGYINVSLNNLGLLYSSIVGCFWTYN